MAVISGSTDAKLESPTQEELQHNLQPNAVGRGFLG
jgi:hypothetical protein